MCRRGASRRWQAASAFAVQNLARATDARTRAYCAQTLPNPKLRGFANAEVAAICRPLIFDYAAAP